MFSLKLETVTSPNLPPLLGGVTAVVGEEFCLEHGTYSVETVCLPTANLQTHSLNPPLAHPSRIANPKPPSPSLHRPRPRATTMRRCGMRT